MKRVAVIGVGAGGLAALRRLVERPSTFRAVAYEQMSVVGGTWVYTERTGRDRHGLPIHSSMYKQLKTNLPKEVMAFPGFPFPSHLPSFVTHQDVLRYLDAYTDHYGLRPHIQFDTVVSSVSPVKDGSGHVTWEVKTRKLDEPKETISKQTFDAVIVCNGHYTLPLIPDIPGNDEFKGQVMHSHNYRIPEPFTGKTMLLLGAGASGRDVALDIAPVANKVLLAHNYQKIKAALPPNVFDVPGIERLTEKGVILKDGTEHAVDIVLYCTGYHYTFPFLSEECHPRVADERVTPLYKHLVHIDHPSMCFVGVCKTICPFPNFDCQARYFLATLDGSVRLPSADAMRRSEREDLEWRRRDLGMPTRHAHTMGRLQWEYNDGLAAEGQFDPIDRAVQTLYDHTHDLREGNLVGYKRYNFQLLPDGAFKATVADPVDAITDDKSK